MFRLLAQKSRSFKGSRSGSGGPGGTHLLCCTISISWQSPIWPFIVKTNIPSTPSSSRNEKSLHKPWLLRAFSRTDAGLPRPRFSTNSDQPSKTARSLQSLNEPTLMNYPDLRQLTQHLALLANRTELLEEAPNGFLRASPPDQIPSAPPLLSMVSTRRCGAASLAGTEAQQEGHTCRAHWEGHCPVCPIQSSSRDVTTTPQFKNIKQQLFQLIYFTNLP